MGENPQNLTQTENTNGIYNKLTKIIDNHYVFKAEKGNTIFLMDLEIPKGEKPFYDELALDLTKMILGEGNIEYQTDGSTFDVVDEIVKYPLKRILLFTDFKHLRYHFLDYVKITMDNKDSEIKEFEKKNYTNDPHYFSVIYTNWDEPAAAGVYLFAYDIPKEVLRDIGHRILIKYFNLKRLLPEKTEEHFNDYKYILFQHYYFIYRNKIISKYIPIKLTDSEDSEEDEDELLYPIKWFYLMQISRTTLNRIFDP